MMKGKNKTFRMFAMLGVTGLFLGASSVMAALHNNDMTVTEDLLSGENYESMTMDETMKALSGDTVGNGRTQGGLEGDHDDDLDNFDDFYDLFYGPEEREKLNHEFQNLLDQLGIDPTTIRSGDTVGNGGGLLEAQAAYTYVNLSKHIISTFEQNFIEFSDEDQNVLMEILSGIVKNPGPEKILFMSEKNHPGFFFKEGIDPAPRVAKTGFSLDFPIFINRDMVYRNIDMNSRYWIGLLIHEMGHQVGVRNHSYLDELGAKVVAVSEMNRTELGFIMAPRKIVEVSLYNHDFIDGTPDFTVSHNGHLHSVTDWRNASLQETCGPALSFSGVSLSNLHWKDRGVNGPGTAMTIRAGAWAEVKCMDQRAGVFYNRVVDVEIELEIDSDRMKSKVKVQ